MPAANITLDDVLAQIADHTNDAVLITEGETIDLPGPRILYVNKAFTHMTGYEASEAVGRTPRMLQGPGTEPESRQTIGQALSRWQPIRTDIRNYKKDGEEFWTELSLVPVFEGDWVRFWVAIQRDVTGRRLIEEHRKARAAAEAADQLKSRFLSHMSHELRTPLNAILGFSEMISLQTLGPVGNAKYADYASDIHFSARHLLDIISDILDVSKIEAGKVTLEEQAVSVSSIFADTRRILQDAIDRGRVELELESEADFSVLLDPRLIRQALLNLVSNALKFTPEGGRMSISALRLANGDLTFVVNDTGAGIPSSRVPEALEPYISIGGTEGPSMRRGTGLGLPIAKSFIELHGGKLLINSELGVGTSVFIVLPAARILGGERSHADKAADLERIADEIGPTLDELGPEALDRLPVDAVLLDNRGTVLAFNAVEQRFSGYSASGVIGSNFFREVAPCTRGGELERTVTAGIAAGHLQATLTCTYPFPERPMQALVAARLAKNGRGAWLLTKWI